MRLHTIKENCVDAWVTNFLATEKVNIFDAHILRNFDDWFFFGFSCYVSHQSQIFDQSATLQYARR